VEQHGTDAGSEEQELPLKNRIMILNKILHTLLNDNIFGATKQPNGDYSCHYCSKSMKNKGNMRQHIRTHRTVKRIGLEILYEERVSILHYMISNLNITHTSYDPRVLLDTLTDSVSWILNIFKCMEIIHVVLTIISIACSFLSIN